MSKKENHHHVQRAYLKGFCSLQNPSELWEYDKKTKKISNRIKSVSEICSIHRYHSFKREDGTFDDHTIENALSKIENSFNRSLRNLSPPQEIQKYKISETDQFNIANYIALQIVRGPMFRDKVHSFARDNILKTFEILYNSEKLPEPPPELKQSFKNGEGIEAVVNNSFSLEPMSQAIPNIINSLLKKIWIFYIPHPDISLITSDNPARFNPIIPKQQVGPAHPYSVVSMPLRNDLSISIAPMKPFNFKRSDNYKIFFQNKTQTKDFNRETARNAIRYVYNKTKDETLGKMIFKYPAIETTTIPIEISLK